MADDNKVTELEQRVAELERLVALILAYPALAVHLENEARRQRIV